MPAGWKCLALLASLIWLLPAVHAAPADASARNWSFGILGQPERLATGDESLRQQLAAANRERFSFVVATGIKSTLEACTDALYEERLELLEQSRHPLVLSPSAADWAECRREDRSSAALDRLARVRDLYFGNMKQSPLQVAQQSQSAQFRAFAENLRWEVKGVMFATINLPADNNHYVADAGRNSEFEDRLIANRHWLQRVLQAAKSHHARALVLFVDGDPHLWQATRSPPGQRDGYAEIRRHLRDLASQFNGKLLLVHQGEGRARAGMRWRGNVGELVPWPGVTRVTVQARSGNLTAVKAD